MEPFADLGKFVLVIQDDEAACAKLLMDFDRETVLGNFESLRREGPSQRQSVRPIELQYSTGVGAIQEHTVIYRYMKVIPGGDENGVR
jgi:hypothetical protein